MSAPDERAQRETASPDTERLPDAPSPTTQPVPQHAAVAPAPDPMLAPPPIPEPVASGAPYRLPAPPIAPAWVAVPRRPRPIIGPAISVFGALLWAFIVFGTFTTSWLFGAPMNEPTAVLGVLLTTFVMGIVTLRRSRAVAPTTLPRLFGRAVAIALLAVAFFFASLFLAMVAGAAASHNHDFGFAFALVLVSVAASVFGPRVLSPEPPARTSRQRSVLIAVWAAGALATFLAGLDLAANG